MRKIPTVFIRDEEDRKHVSREVNPECQWVIDGEGVPTRKYDGTSCLIRNGNLYRRYEVKPGKIPPSNFEPADEVDPTTGKQPGWVPVGDGPEDRYPREAFEGFESDGTYELVGPKINGNPERYGTHALIPHETSKSRMIGFDPPRDFDGLEAWLDGHEVEGIVWHHPDGRMAKLKRRDFR